MKVRVSTLAWCYFLVPSVVVVALALSGCGGPKTKPALIQPPPVPVMPTISLSISPAAILPNQDATLTWSASSASSCTAQGSWSGTEQLSGSMSVTLSSAAGQTYILECTSDSGLTARSSVT